MTERDTERDEYRETGESLPNHVSRSERERELESQGHLHSVSRGSAASPTVSPHSELRPRIIPDISTVIQLDHNHQLEHWVGTEEVIDP